MNTCSILRETQAEYSREAEQRLLDHLLMLCGAIPAKLGLLEDGHRFKRGNFVFNTFSMFLFCK